MTLELEELHQLCLRLLGIRGGVSLAKSLLLPTSNPGIPNPSGQDKPPWCVCSNCKAMGYTKRKHMLW